MKRGTNIQHGQARRRPWPRDVTIGVGLILGSVVGVAGVGIMCLLTGGS